MSRQYRRLLVIAAGLLAVSLAIGGILWQRVGALENDLASAVQGWADTQNKLDNGIWEGKWLAEKYPPLRAEVTMRLGFAGDACLFITPDDPAVAALVKEITAPPTTTEQQEAWIDTERMYYWIVRNIEYSADSYSPLLPDSPEQKLTWQGDFWRFPAETIRDRAGDCEDTTTLLISMLLNHSGRAHPVWGIGIESTIPKPARHIAVAVPVVNNQLSILDATARYHTSWPQGWGIAAKETSAALHDWFERWKDKMADAHVYLVFSEDFYIEFTSNEEFCDWVRSLNY